MSRLITRRAANLVKDGARSDGAAFTVPGGPFIPATYLTTPTPDGSGETTHPDVIDFLKQYGIAQWNGYRYWMGVTPFPSSNNDFENPCILASNDNLTWVVPPGLTNPLAERPTDHINSFNSDTELWFDPVTSTLHLFYRSTWFSSPETYRTMHTTSNDGVTWSAHAQVYTASGNAKRLSPAVVKDGDEWKIWVVEEGGHAVPQIELYRTSDITAWPSHTDNGSTNIECTISPPLSGRQPWHIDVFRHGVDYFMLLDTCDLGTDGLNAALHLGRSADGIHWNVTNAIMTPDGSTSWTGNKVYRGSAHIADGVFRIWFGASGGIPGNVWHTGYTEVPIWW